MLLGEPLNASVLGMARSVHGVSGRKSNIGNLSLSIDASLVGGSTYIDGRYMLISEAAVRIMDWGYGHPDVTYDVVSVWDGRFFRLGNRLRRFRASMDKLRARPKESDEDIRALLHRLVALSGLGEAYVAMDCLRGPPAPGQPHHPSQVENRAPGDAFEHSGFWRRAWPASRGRQVSLKETRESDEVFLTTTAGGVMPASRIDGRILGEDRPGPISTRIPEAFWAKRASGWHATRVDYDSHS